MGSRSVLIEASALLKSVAADDFEIDAIAVVGGPLAPGSTGHDVVT